MWRTLNRVTFQVRKNNTENPKKGIRSTSENLEVLYEDNHLIAINKRPGDIVQGDKTGDIPLSEIVKTYIARKYDKPGAVYLGVVHRLDRPTSGIVLFARTSKALARLNAAFSKKKPHKTYWAVVESAPKADSGRLVHWLKKNPQQNKSYAYEKEIPGSKKAELTYRTIGQLDHYSLLEIQLITGRHHQIRAQLGALGAIIKGDVKYGGKRGNRNGSIHLHARELSLEHPVGNSVVNLIADPPDDPVWNQCLRF